MSEQKTREALATGHRVFDAEITITRMVRVMVPTDQAVTNGDDPEDVAEEFALGGSETWPDWVITEDDDVQVESISEVYADE